MPTPNIPLYKVKIKCNNINIICGWQFIYGCCILLFLESPTSKGLHIDWKFQLILIFWVVLLEIRNQVGLPPPVNLNNLRDKLNQIWNFICKYARQRH